MSDAVILIADDDAGDVYFLTEAFRRVCPDFRVVSVTDGQQALDYLAGQGPYADRAAHPFPTHLFLDVKMPRMSGLEVLRWLRGREDLRGLPVTVLSGSQLSGDRQQAEDLGAAYLVKPVEFSALLDLVRDFCRSLKR